MSVYLDASIIVPAFVAEPASERVQSYLDSVEQELFVSEFGAAEVASAFSRFVRMGKLPNSVAAAALADFDAWRAANTSHVEIGEPDIRFAHSLVRRFDLMLRTPDALHAVVCQRRGLTLATLDQRLTQAAAQLGIGLVL